MFAYRHRIYGLISELAYGNSVAESNEHTNCKCNGNPKKLNEQIENDVFFHNNLINLNSTAP